MVKDAFRQKLAVRNHLCRDYNLPERFDLWYTGNDNEKQTRNDSQSTIWFYGTFIAILLETPQEISHFG